MNSPRLVGGLAQSKCGHLALVAAALFLAWLQPSALTAAVTYVQSNAATPQPPQTSVPVTYTAAQAAGDLNVVVVGWNDSTATVSTVTDSKGNIYVRAVGPTVQAGLASQSIYYAKNILAATAGSNIVTVTFATAAASPDIRILEYSGADTNSPVDVTAAASGTSTAANSGAATTTTATDLIFGANLVQTTTSATGAGFTRRLLTSPDGDIAEDETVTAVGSYSATSTVNPSGGWIMQMVAFRTPVADTTPPSAPTNLTATVSGATINLSWTASTDNIGVTGYLVERCQGASCTTFAQIGTSTTVTYSDPGLAAGSYSYRVRATDAAGNLSGYSNTATAVLTDVTPPTAPTNLTATVSGTQINLSWTASTDNVGVTGYRVERCQGASCTTFAQIATPTTTTYSDTGLGAGSYSYRVRATDAAGNLSTYSNTATGVIPDTTPPTAPTNLTATAASSTQINLTWTAATDNVGVTGYLVERCQGANCTTFAQIATPTTTTYNDTGLTTNTNYSYRVRATDAAGNLGPYSNTASATTQTVATTITYVQSNAATPQTPQTSVPVTYTAAQAAGDLNVVAIGWNDSTATVTAVTDHSGNTYVRAVGPTIQTGIASQSIYYAKNIVAAAAGANIVTVTFSTGAVSPDVRILEYKGADPSNPVDVTAAASGNSATSSSGAVTTTTATDLLFAANLAQTFTSGAGAGFTQRLLTSPDGDIAEDQFVTAIGSYTATAPVSSGQWIMQMVAFRTPVGDSTPPSAPTALTATVAGAQINLSWTASTDNVGVTNYFVERCQGASCTTFAQIGTSTTTTYGDPGLSLASYSYRVRATDAAGNLSGYSNTATGVISDVTPPTAPSNLTATVSGTQINLSWVASTDNVGVTGYRVERCQGASCTTFVQIATPTTTTYSDAGLAGGTYSYRVRATDAAGNLSPYSNTAIGVIPDTTPPTTRTALTATAASGNQINLSWTASTDNVGVTGYFVERCQGAGCTTFVQIAAPTTTTYSDAGLAAGTSYSYRVRATDAANNLSPYSNTASATTTVAATTITYVQSNAATPQTSQTSVTATYTAAQAAGDLNVVAIGWNDSTATVATVTDRSGNTYVRAVGPTVQSGLASQSIYYAKNIVAAAAGTNIVTVTFSSGAFSADLRILEYKGADLNNPVDVTATGSGSSTTSASTAVTTTNATDLVFGANLVQTATIGAGAGFTSRLLTQPDGDIAEDEMVTAIGSYSATAPVSPGGSWIMQMVAFRTADITPPSVPANLTATTISANQINLSWTASTDNVGVTGYLLERCQGAACSSFAQIANVTTTTYSDAGLTGSISYSYRVRATDAANNLSAYSNTATATTSPAPNAPSNVSAVGGGAVPTILTETEYTNFNAQTTHTNNNAFPLTGASLLLLVATSHQHVVFTPSDTFGNTWIPIAGPTSTTVGSDLGMEAWYVPNPIIGQFNDVVSMNLSLPEPLEMSLFVLQNTSSSSPIDALSFIANDNGTQVTTITTPSITTSRIKDRLIAWGKVSLGSFPFLPGPGFTQQPAASDNYINAEVATAPTPGSYSATFTITPAQDWQSIILALANNPNQTTLTWTASTEPGGTVSQYLVERCAGVGCSSFAQVGTTAITAYIDSGLTASTSYSYRVRAQDTTNSVGPYSTVVTIATPASIPSLPGSTTAALDSSQTQVNLTWFASFETGGTISKYLVERCAGVGCTSFTQIGTSTTTTYNDPSLAAGAYSYRLRAVDAANTMGPYSSPVTTVVPDTTPPSAPTNLTATPSTSLSQINLSWSAATDNVGVTGYLLERCQGASCSTFAQIATPTVTTYTDSGLSVNTSYSYRVRATDAAGNLGAYSTIATAVTANLPVPSAPGSPSVTTGGAAPVVAAVQSYINGTSQTSHTTAAFNSTGGDVIVIGASAHQGVTFTPSDNFGNTWTSIAGPISTTTGADLRTEFWYARNPIVGPGHTVTMGLSSSLPLVISVVVAKGSNASSPIDAVSLIGSDNGTQATSAVSPSLTTSVINDLLIGFAKVSAGATFTSGTGFTQLPAASTNFLDAESGTAATPGVYSAPFTITPAQTWQAGVVAVANNPNQTTVSWTAATEAGGTITQYLVERCSGASCATFAQVGTTATTTFNDLGLTASTSYSYRVRAEDAASTLGPYSTVVTIVTPAPIPSLPGNLTATLDSSQTQSNLAWTASLETGGTISKYLVERCAGVGCASFTQIAAPTTITYNDPSLGAGSYTYRVRAVDAANNNGPYSNLATTVVPDTTPPSAPTNLTATASTTTSQINLSWTAATDNVGVTGYLLERCQGASCSTFAQIATPTVTTYTDSGLSVNTSYSYRVRATDAAGNLGAYSTIATAVTANLPVPSAPGSPSVTTGGAAPVVAAVQSYINGTSQTSHTTAAFNSTGGDVIVIGASAHQGVTFTPSDNFGNTWTSIAGPISTTTGADLRTEFWYARNPIVGPGHTVTMGLSSSLPLVISVVVAKGSNASSPIDAVSLIGSDNGTQATSAVSPSLTTSVINDLLIGFAKVSAGATFTSGTGFTQLPAASTNFLDAESGTAATPGVYSAPFTITPAQTWQAGVVAVANNPNQTTVSWTAATEAGGSITQYFVERCQGASCSSFVQIGTTAGTSFNDTGLTASTSYSYRVRAEDAASTLGPYSTVVTIVTPAPIPSLPGNLTATLDSSQTQSNLAWTASLETGGTISQYLVERCAGVGCASFTQIAAPTTTTYNDPSLAAGSYTYRVRAVDAANNNGPYSNLATAVVPDTTPPAAPTNLTATASTTTSQINLSWTAATDNVGVTGYLLERCQGASCSTFTQIATPTVTTYTDSGLSVNTSYSYRVRATDAAGNLGAYSTIATAVTANLPVPSAPGSPSVATGGGAPIVVAVQSLIDGAFITSHTTATFDSTGGDVIVIAADSLAGVTFTPSDNFGNTWTSIAGPISTTTGADLRTEFWYARNPIVGPGHTVTMTLSTGEAMVMSVIVVKGSNASSPIDAVSLIGSDNGTQTTSAVSPSLTTSVINDLLIGFAKVSAGATFTSGTGFTQLPGASTNFLDAESGTAATPGVYSATFTLSSAQNWQAGVVAVANNPNQTTVSWTAATEAGGSITQYFVERCQGASCSVFAQIGTTAGTSFNDPGLTASTSYSYRVRAEDAASTLGPYSTVVTIVTPAPIPSLPGNLTATLDSSHTQNNLAWTASLETGGTISKYLVERCAGVGCASFTQIAAPTTITYNDPSLGAGSYTYRVRAVDAANNNGPYSNLATAVVPDTTPPAAPTNLTATASTTTSQINLSWTAATDNVGVTGYLLERCQGASCSTFTQIATPTVTTYTDSGLSVNTSYSYRVRATDAAGNLGAYSTIATAMTANLPVPSAPGSPSVTTSGPGPVVAAVQSLIDGSFTTSHTTAAFDSTGGDLIVLCGYSLAGVTFTPSDNFGNTWIPIAGPTSTTTGADIRTEFWYVRNPVVGPGHTITMTLSSGEALVMSIVVIKGSNISSPIDAVSLLGSDNGSQSINVVSPSLATSVINDLLVGFSAVSAGATFTSGSGFTQLAGASTNFLAAESGPAATLGSYSATFTLNSAQNWQAGIVAVANNPNQTTVSWTAATEAGGSITQYFVERCQGASCSVFAQIGTTAGTSFNDPGLTASTSYSYRVRAEDAASTLGPYSTVVTVSTPAPIPSLPGNLTATAASSTQNNLSWIASQETGGTIADYLVQRCQGAGCANFAQIGTSATTTYTDTTVTANTTYSYRVRAVDAIGNNSPFSNVATDVTPGP